MKEKEKTKFYRTDAFATIRVHVYAEVNAKGNENVEEKLKEWVKNNWDLFMDSGKLLSVDIGEIEEFSY